MKIEIEYENLLDRAVANNHCEEEVLMALLACLSSVTPLMDGSAPLPEILTAHTSSL